MTLLRAASRTMLASYFIATGVKALRNPAPLVPLAEPLADKFVPLVKQYAPDQVAGFIPEDAKSLVRLNGATQVLGGLALATGKGRRFGALLLAGSLVPSTIAKYPFWRGQRPRGEGADRTHFLKNVSLLGGVLLASGTPRESRAWPGGRRRVAIAGQGHPEGGEEAVERTRRSIGDSAGDLADSALAGGAALVGAVVASSRKARKEAAKQLEDAQSRGREAAKQAKKDAPKPPRPLEGRPRSSRPSPEAGRRGAGGCGEGRQGGARRRRQAAEAAQAKPPPRRRRSKAARRPADQEHPASARTDRRKFVR